jgi:hypothetical protein
LFIGTLLAAGYAILHTGGGGQSAKRAFIVTIVESGATMVRVIAMLARASWRCSDRGRHGLLDLLGRM